MRNTIFSVGRIAVLTAVGIATSSLVPVMTSSARADSFNAKLGAWEMTFTTTTSGSLIPPDVLAKMSPDQRAKLEQSMKARASKPNTHVSNQCLTKEDLDQNRMIKDENDDEGVQCKIAVTSKSSSKLVIDKTCPAPREQEKGSGVLFLTASR